MQAWEAFLQKLEQTIGKQSVNRWLRPLKVVEFDACNLHLEPENSFQVAWFEEHIRELAKKEFLNNNSHIIKIHFTANTRQKRKKDATQTNFAQEIHFNSDPVDPLMLFSNFIYDHYNEMTVEFFKQLSPGAFNPIFLYGEEGVGKTHLLMACANLLRNKGLTVCYVHAESFTEHVVHAIRNSQMRKFRDIYRNHDVLIIDDIHHIARKAATQEELFHTFNALHTANKQIILSSYITPSRLEDIEPRLTSRFEWGIVLQLTPLTEKKMAQVLKNKARLHHFPLSDPLVHFLLEKFSTSSKSMMRALEALLMRHKSSAQITLEEAERALADLLDLEKKEQLTPDKILSATSAYFGIRKEDILSKSQFKEIAFPRKLAMYLCRKKLRMPYLAIGKTFKRDHSTVMTSIRLIEKGSDEIEASLTEIEDLLLKS